MSVIISLNNVSLTLPGPSKKPVAILQDIQLEVQKGETISIIGPSGSGKTSLLMVIAGVEKSSGGDITICDHDITPMTEDQLAQFRGQHTGIVFQNFHLIPTMTARENVALALEFAGKDHVNDKAAFWLDQVGLSKRMDHYPSQLSGGEQQRVALARAFATEPELLLADEPTGNLDGENSELVVKLLFDMQQKFGSTLLLITHDKALAGKASRTLLMKDGRLSDGLEHAS